jgi:hypothetical protein
MQVVVKENPNSKPNSVPQQNQRKKSNSKMMQIVFEDKDRHTSDANRHNVDGNHHNVDINRHNVDVNRHNNANHQELRRTDDDTFFDDYNNDETFRRDSRKTVDNHKTVDHLQTDNDLQTVNDLHTGNDVKTVDDVQTGNDLFPAFPNFPPLTSSEKRATSYTRISFAKPANFDIDTNSNCFLNLFLLNKNQVFFSTSVCLTQSKN